MYHRTLRVPSMVINGSRRLVRLFCTFSPVLKVTDGGFGFIHVSSGLNAFPDGMMLYFESYCGTSSEMLMLMKDIMIGEKAMALIVRIFTHASRARFQCPNAPN